MGTKRGTLKIFCLLIGVLLFSMACAKLDNMKQVVPIFKGDPTEQSDDSLPVIVQRFVGQGTHRETLVSEDSSTSCESPYEVTATIDNKGVIYIEGTGPCISNYASCSPSDTDRCSIYAKGKLSDKKAVSMSSCNTELEVVEDRVTVDEKHMAGTFVCSFGMGNYDTISLTFDLALVK